ncbi:MAG: tRNA (cytidine(34)-2'-O)-methyltransferase [Planctomycetota bacterium]
MSPLVHVALLEPKIPQNTGNIGRTVLAYRGRLHLLGELGFDTDEKALRRAGLDYWQHLDWARHPSVEALEQSLPAETRVFGFSTRGTTCYTDVSYRPGDCLLFGDEVKGLPPETLARTTSLRIPILDERVRSLNLANAVAVSLAEVARQLGYPTPAGTPCTRN